METRYLLTQSGSKNSSESLESCVSQIETLQKLTEDLDKLKQSEDHLIFSRFDLNLKNLESRLQNIEGKELQKFLEINHKCELHGILLGQSHCIDSVKSDLNELNYSISNDDRLSGLEANWVGKMKSIENSMENLHKRIEMIKIVPLSQEILYLQREISEDNIKKEQELVRIELIEENIGKMWKKFEGGPVAEELEMEQELFLQNLSKRKGMSD